MTKKFVVWTALITIAVLFLIFFSFSWTMNRQDFVARGLAKPFFPYFKYSQDELNKLFPQYINADVATTQSPEETHKKFADALKSGDIDVAVQSFVPGKRKEWKENLQTIKEKNFLDLMISDISIIKQEMVLDTIATYTYISEVDGKKFNNTISFVKNSQGVWLIDSL